MKMCLFAGLLSLALLGCGGTAASPEIAAYSPPVPSQEQCLERYPQSEERVVGGNRRALGARANARLREECLKVAL